MAAFENPKNSNLLLHGLDGKMVPPPSLNGVLESMDKVQESLEEFGKNVVELCRKYKEFRRIPSPPKPGEYMIGLTPPPKPPVFSEFCPYLLDGRDRVSS